MAPILRDSNHRRGFRAYSPTSNTAAHDNHEKINSWGSFSLYGYRYLPILGFIFFQSPMQVSHTLNQVFALPKWFFKPTASHFSLWCSHLAFPEPRCFHRNVCIVIYNLVMHLQLAQIFR